MKTGDIVRLKQPFKPQPQHPKEYCFGIITDLVTDPVQEGLPQDSHEEPELSNPLELSEILVYLYDPDTSTIFTDELGVQAVFAFKLDEVEIWQI